jgi:hypothetical protein
MNARKMTKQVRLSKWAQIIHERQESGQTVKQWCKENGINEKTYYYWQRKLREAIYERIEGNQAQPSSTALISEQGVTITKPVFTEVKLTDKTLYPASISHGHQGTQSPAWLQIEINGIKITTEAVYPVERLAPLLRELIRPC